MAITEYNLHGYDPDKYDEKKGAKGMDKRDQQSNRRAMFQMQTPQWFEFMRNLRMNKSSIREQTKDKQIFENNLYSDDVLIRSTVENQRHVLPFISMIPQFVQEHKLYDLSDLSKYADRAVYSQRRAFDSDNTGMKDESKKEDQLEQYLDNK